MSKIMTPKEKAKELYDKFLPIVRQSDLYDTYHNKAKECANIVCEEQLKLANLMDGGFSFEKEIEHWQETMREVSLL